MPNDGIEMTVEFITIKRAREDIGALDRLLQAIPVSLARKGARKATRAAAKLVLAEARALVPHDTGELERSLKVRARKRSRTHRGTVGHSVVTGGDAFYGKFVELGTSHQAADPFLRPALWGNRTAKLQVYVNVLRQWLTRDAPKALAALNEADISGDS